MTTRASARSRRPDAITVHRRAMVEAALGSALGSTRGTGADSVTERSPRSLAFRHYMSELVNPCLDAGISLNSQALLLGIHSAGRCSPCDKAYRTNSTRLEIPTLSKIRSKYFLMVCSLSPSAEATPRLVRPAATSATTCSSRGVRSDLPVELSTR